MTDHIGTLCIDLDGLTIDTEIDPTTQDAAEKSIAKNIDARDPVISTMTMIQPGTGLILAMAQNRRELSSGARRERQPCRATWPA